MDAVGSAEHPRATSLEALAKLKDIVGSNGTVTAGNASGVDDGACAMLIASEEAAKRHGLTPRARIIGMGRPVSRRASWRFALCTMCIGVGQGIAIAIERV